MFSTNPEIIFAGKTPKLKIVINDPDDDKFIECAVELGADYIVSGDKELLTVKKFGNIRILSPRQFLNEVIDNHL